MGFKEQVLLELVKKFLAELKDPKDKSSNLMGHPTFRRILIIARVIQVLPLVRDMILEKLPDSWKVRKIAVNCPCGKRLKYPPEMIGETVQCPECRDNLWVGPNESS